MEHCPKCEEPLPLPGWKTWVPSYSTFLCKRCHARLRMKLRVNLRFWSVVGWPAAVVFTLLAIWEFRRGPLYGLLGLAATLISFLWLSSSVEPVEVFEGPQRKALKKHGQST